MRLNAENIFHRYSKRDGWVLEDVSLFVESGGDTVALTGPSGSGKTTLLSILGGLQKPTKGSVRYEPNGHETGFNVAWIHQTAHGLGTRSAFDNVCLGLLARGHRRGNVVSETNRLLQVVNLEHRAQTPLRTLSGGEQQRVSIARALGLRAQFILADEPTGNLDQASTSQVLDALFLQEEPRPSIVVATHDPAVAQRCKFWLRIPREQD